jgi:hypothetical protein
MSETFPDVEGAIRQYLRDDQTLVDLLNGRRIFFAVPDSPTWPLITVSRVGGGDLGDDSPLDVALISLDVWGDIDAGGRPRKIETTEVVNTMRSALQRIRGRTAVTADVDLFGVNVVSTVYAPDPDNGRPHYAVTAEVTAISS